MPENPHIAALVIISSVAFICAVWFGWIYFWAKVSDHEWWGLVAAMSPVVIGSYFFLVWRLS